MLIMQNELIGTSYSVGEDDIHVNDHFNFDVFNVLIIFIRWSVPFAVGQVNV
jgi:hypothetical protein